MKVKLNCTMYYDYWSDCLDWYKPEGKVDEDYSVFRKGSVFDTYFGTIEDALDFPEKLIKITEKVGKEISIEDARRIVCLGKQGAILTFDNWKAFCECEWLDTVQEKKKKESNK